MSLMCLGWMNLPFSVERGVVLAAAGARGGHDTGVLGVQVVLVRQLPCAMR